MIFGSLLCKCSTAKNRKITFGHILHKYIINTISKGYKAHMKEELIYEFICLHDW